MTSEGKSGKTLIISELYHGMTKFKYFWMELDGSECLRQSGILTNLNEQLAMVRDFFGPVN